MKFDPNTVSLTDAYILQGARRGDPDAIQRLAVIEARSGGSRRSGRSTRPLPTDLASVQEEIRRLASIDPRSRAANARLTQLRPLARSLGEARDRARRAQAPKPSAPAVIREKVIDPESATRYELRDGALRILERAHRLSPEQQDHLELLLRSSDQNRDAAEIARRTLVTESPSYVSAFWKTMRFDRPIFTPAETFAVNRYRELFADELRAAAEGGTFGLAIPATIDPTIILSSGETAPIVRRAHQVLITTNVYKGVASDATPWSFQDEGSVVADDSPTFVQPVLNVQTARSFIPASIELTQDYPGFVDEFTNLFAAGWHDLLSKKSAVGTGTGEPRGIFTALTAATTPAHVTVTTAGSIGAVDVRAAWDALPQRFLANASWVAHRKVIDEIRNLDGAAAQLDIVTDRQGTMIMGRPVVVTDYAPTFTGTTGSENYLVVGDLLSGYTMAVRAGMTVELVQDMRGTTGRPLAERGLFASARVAMDVTNPNALRLLANS